MKNVPGGGTLQLCTKLNPFHRAIFLKIEECEMGFSYVQGHAIVTCKYGKCLQLSHERKQQDTRQLLLTILTGQHFSLYININNKNQLTCFILAEKERIQRQKANSYYVRGQDKVL